MVLSSVVDYIKTEAVLVFVAGLDVSKAFDSVNHHEILLKLMNFNTPIYVFNTFVIWYSTLCGCIK